MCGGGGAQISWGRGNRRDFVNGLRVGGDGNRSDQDGRDTDGESAEGGLLGKALFGWKPGTGESPRSL